MNQSLKRYKTLKGAQRAALKEARDIHASIDIYRVLVSYAPINGQTNTFDLKNPIFEYFTMGSGLRDHLPQVARQCGTKLESIKRVQEMVGTTDFREVA